MTPAGRNRRSALRREAIDLAERVKELNCLLSISRILKDRRASLPDILARLVQEIPRAWQFPEVAEARVTWDGQEWRTPGFVLTPWRLDHDIRGRSGVVGNVTIAYRERPVPEAASPFLPEEEQLLKAVAERIGDIIELKEAERELDSYQDQLRSLASQLAMTEERERRDLSTYLHDRIGQGLALIKLRLESVRGCAREDDQNRVIDRLCDLAAEVLQETRALTFEISPPILHELGLVPALEWLADHTAERHGLEVVVEAEPTALPLEDDLRALVFRSVYELLNNVVRHAHAQTAVIRVQNTGRFLQVEVRDDGEGFVPERVVRAGTSGGFGLFSVRERLAYVGGGLEVISAPGEGTRAILEVPRDGREHGT